MPRPETYRYFRQDVSSVERMTQELETWLASLPRVVGNVPHTSGYEFRVHSIAYMGDGEVLVLAEKVIT
jgi:hypothetical protein